MRRRNVNFFLFLLTLPILSSAALPTAYIQWQQPLFNVDGTSFEPQEIANFTVHYGLSSGMYTYEYTIPADAREAYIPIPYAGQWYIAMTVTNLNAETSTFSNEVIRSITDGFPKKPRPPTLI